MLVLQLLVLALVLALVLLLVVLCRTGSEPAFGEPTSPFRMAAGLTATAAAGGRAESLETLGDTPGGEGRTGLGDVSGVEHSPVVG